LVDLEEDFQAQKTEKEMQIHQAEEKCAELAKEIG